MSEHPTPEDRPRPDRRKTWAVRALVAVAAYALIGFFGLPALIEWQLPKQASAQLGRQVTLETARFNPFSLRLRLEGLRIKEADGASDALALGAIETDLQWRSIVHRGWVFAHLDIDAPVFRFVRRDGAQSNWSDVLERFESAEPPPDEAPATVPRFSVNNIRIQGGQIDFVDQPVGLEHTLRELAIGIPFISSFPAQVEVDVEPSLSALVNGTRIDVHGRARPFDPTRTTQVDIELAPFDIAPYLAYLPQRPNFRLERGQLGTALTLAFSYTESDGPRLNLHGSAAVTDLAMVDGQGAPLIAFERLGAELADYDVFGKHLHLTRIALQAPEVRATRAADGSLNWARLMAAAPTPEAPTAAAPEEGAQAAPEQPATARPEASGDEAPFRLQIDTVALTGGVLQLSDGAAPGGTFSTRVHALEASLEGLDTGSETPARLTLAAQTDGGERVDHAGTLRLDPLVVEGRLAVTGVPLTRYASYYAERLERARITGGSLAATLPYRFDDAGLRLTQAEATLQSFALQLDDAKRPAVALERLAASGIDLDTGKSRLRIGRIAGNAAALRLVRGRDGAIDLAGIAAAAPADTPAPAEGTPMAVSIGALALDDSTVDFTDRGVSPAAQVTVSALKLETGPVDLAAPGQTPLALEAVINRGGRLAIKGTTDLGSLDTRLRLDLAGLDLSAFAAYIPQAQAIALRSARASLAGTLNLARLTGDPPDIRYQGTLAVADLVARDALNDTDFLRWKSLSVAGMDVGTAPLRIGLDTVRLSDFYSRLILNAEGQLNFRELTGGAPAEAADSAAPGDAGGATLPPIRIGRIELAGGQVQFSDRFIQPNYDADLSDLGGALENLRSDDGSLATLSLTASLDHGAPVEITGQLNPLREDSYLDILATVREFQLPSISTYSGKYVGYGIAKGKLSADLSYKIEDRVLKARNDIRLDQLTFGDKVESKDAVKLPVQLAVALLKNPKGEIDLSVPVTGSLDDPKFSVGGVVMRAFVNLIGKAVTSPFALLGSVFGGGESLSYIDYAPGEARLSAEAVKKLQTLAKALAERPALKIEITGRVDPATDTPGLRQAWLRDRMRERLRAQLLEAGEQPPPLEQIALPERGLDALLEQAYDAADIDKPRNLIGLAKSIPPDEMRALMLAAAPAGEADLARLGKQRAQGVQDWLVGEGKVNAARIFLVAPKADAKDAAASRVDFSLR
jgi:uncharacterized protein involved in outer membrane biogenesis